jgi:hypothetical protein
VLPISLTDPHYITISQQLHLIAVHLPKVNQLTELVDQFAAKRVYGVINQVDQTYTHVQKIPELMWDLLDYAERPIALQLEFFKDHLRDSGAQEAYLLYNPTLEASKWNCRNLFFLITNEPEDHLSVKMKALNLSAAAIQSIAPYKWVNLKMNGEIRIQTPEQYHERI